MNSIDWDDDENIERWCTEQREVAARYLKAQPVKFGAVGEWPAWHVAPYVSLWAVESVASPGKVGWWVISGDLPTDYVSGTGVPDPRSAVKGFAKRWAAAASKMERGEKPDDIVVGNPENASELAPLLKVRAELLTECTNDDSNWDD